MIFEIIGFACLGHLLVDFIQDLNLEELNRKPFNCNMCFSYWLSFIPFTVQYGLFGILLSAITGVASEILYRAVEKL